MTNQPMMRQCDPEPVAEVEHPGESPFLQEFYMVESDGYRCMAYRDQEGKWHSAFRGAELPGNVTVLE